MKKITYTYDSMNRRVARSDEKGTTQYLYGNPNHPFQLTAVRSPSGSLSRYHYDDFGLLFALERHNNWYYITTDQLGTPRVVCDADGELVKVLEYDSFGQVMADSNPEFELHISFPGGLIDVETELVRFGFRDYDAVAGKWTAKAHKSDRPPIYLVGAFGQKPLRIPIIPDKYTIAIAHSQPLPKNPEIIMSDQNIQQQIKNTHSLLPASRDRAYPKIQQTQTGTIFVISIIIVGAKHWPRQYGNHTPNIHWPMLRPLPTLRPQKFRRDRGVWAKHSPILTHQKFWLCCGVWAKHSPISIIGYIRNYRWECFAPTVLWYDGDAIALTKKFNK